MIFKIICKVIFKIILNRQNKEINLMIIKIKNKKINIY